MPSLGLLHDARTQTTLSPQLQRAVRLLQLSTLDFAQELRDVVGRNPFLESVDLEASEVDPNADPNDGPSADGDEDHAASEVSDDRGEELGPWAELDAAGEQELRLDDPLRAGLEAGGGPDRTDGDDFDRDAWSPELGGGRGARVLDDGELGGMDHLAAGGTLAEHLNRQLQVLPLPARDLALAQAVVASLDDDGYLRVDLDELLPEGEDFDPPVQPEELRIALRRVQALEPAGVGARDVAECLQLQLPAIACSRERALAARIIERHLPLLAARDAVVLARALRCEPLEAEQVADRIRRFDPRPGWRYGGAAPQYLVPDVVVRKQRGGWSVALNPAVTPRVRVHQVYAEMFQRSRQAERRRAVRAADDPAAPDSDAELAAHLQEARWTVRNIEQRFATILSVAQEIVRRQSAFFEYGPLAMKPMALRDVAERVGLHESTVSRVTNNKYMSTPLGVFELKYFFSRTMTGATGHEYSGTAIRGLVKDMIDAERPEAPLSDVDIARQLARQGLTVARRTVTKYRQALKIEAVERRRRVAA